MFQAVDPPPPPPQPPPPPVGVGWVVGWWGGGVVGVVGWLGGWVVGWLGGWVVGWLGGWVVGWLGGWVVGWLGGWVVGWLGGWVVGWLGGWVVGWLGGWVVGWLGGWVVGWLGGWVVGWLGGWGVVRSWFRLGGLAWGWFRVGLRWVSGGFGVWVDLGLGLGLRRGCRVVWFRVGCCERFGVWDRSCRAHTVLDSIPSIASIIPKMRMMRGSGGTVPYTWPRDWYIYTGVNLRICIFSYALCLILACTSDIVCLVWNSLCSDLSRDLRLRPFVSCSAGRGARGPGRSLARRRNSDGPVQSLDLQRI